MDEQVMENVGFALVDTLCASERAAGNVVVHPQFTRTGSSYEELLCPRNYPGRGVHSNGRLRIVG